MRILHGWFEIFKLRLKQQLDDMAIRAHWHLKKQFLHLITGHAPQRRPLGKHFYQWLIFRHKNHFGENTKPGSWNLIEQMSESKPIGPKWAKWNLTRIHEYKVLHLDEIKSSSNWKDLTWQWFTHKSLRWNEKIENLTWPKLMSQKCDVSV